MGSENQVLIVLPIKDFQDAEYQGVENALSEASIGMKVAAATTNECSGIAETRIMPDYTFDNVDSSQFDGVIFIGGPGTENYLHEESAHELAVAFSKEGKLVAAICWAAAILANAGILKGKKATAWSGAANDLINNGAEFTHEPVVVDGNIVTASGPDAADQFGRAVANYLLGKN